MRFARHLLGPSALRLFPVRPVVAMVFCVMLPVGVAMAQQTWWVQSADYGVGSQHADVTAAVRKLASGPNFKVNNTNLGVDPAPGKDKTLRIVAKDAAGKTKEFTYVERTVVPAAMFAGGPGSGKPGWGAGKPATQPAETVRGETPHGRVEPGQIQTAEEHRSEYNQLRINSAGWGIPGKMKDVTEHVQSMARNNVISTKVDSQTMGGDPVPGKKKELVVEYLYRGRAKKVTVPDGGTLHIP